MVLLNKRWLRGAVINLRKGFLIKDNGHLAEMTEPFLIGREKICTTKRTMLVHGKNSTLIPLAAVMQSV